MKPAPFIYVAPDTIEAALALKAEHGDEARFLAGGQSLVPAMNFRLAQPAVVIDLNRLAELAYVRPAAGAVRIGALTRYRALERDETVARRLPLVAEALPHVAHPQIRTRGTLGGNLAHADPASEMPAVVLALGGRLRARSARGERTVAAQDFFVNVLTTALRHDELLVEIELPDRPPRTGTCFLEFARRRGDFALMGVAAAVSVDEGGACVEARLAYCSAAETPLLATDAARSLAGRRLDPPALREAAALAAAATRPTGNAQAGAAFQRHLAGVLARRALETAAARAGAA